MRNADALAGLLGSLLDLPARLAALEAEVRGLRGEVAALRRSAPTALAPVPEAAEALGVSQATVRRRIRDGSLPVVRLGRVVRVDLTAVRAPPEVEVEAEVLRLATLPGG